MKRCSRCKRWKNESEFYKNKSKKGGLNNQCKRCGNQYRNKEKLKQYQKQYRQTVRGKYVIYKLGAKRYKRIFKLTLGEFKEIVLQPCIYCGKPSAKGIQLNGIDRIDNTKGYIKGNCAPCCEWCNRMKLIYDNDAFLKHIYIMGYFNSYKPKWINNMEI